MGREVRMVPADWQHPRYPADYYREALRGRYIALYKGGGFESADAEWMEGWHKWQEGLCKSYSDGDTWKPIEPEFRGTRYSEYAGERPSPDDYMPDWPADRRTHYMMYEDTSEGTPISPAFATPEELARWLADTGASSFADCTATYEQWLRIAKGGYAPSAVMIDGALISGVEAA